MSKQENKSATNLRHVLSIGLAAVMLSTALTYVLGAEAILQSPYAEPAHNLYMSMYAPLIGAISGDHSSMAQMHGGQTSQSQTQGGMGVLANNVLGSPAGMNAAGLGAVVIQSVTVLAVAAFVISWKQRSFVVAGLLSAGGIILMILPLANMNFAIPGPIIGLIVGLTILGLGVAKGIRTAMAVTAGPR